jgi:hypothetical protein
LTARGAALPKAGLLPAFEQVPAVGGRHINVMQIADIKYRMLL